MRPLIIALVGMVTLCALLIGTTTIGARIPGSYHIDWLDDGRSADCTLPCWYGITPGVTSFDEATQRVRAIPAVDQSSLNGRAAEYTASLWFALDSTDGRIDVQLQGKNSAHVESISFYPLRVGGRTTIQLAALITRFGAPIRIAAPSPANTLYQLYHYQYAIPNFEVLVFVPKTSTASGCNRLSATAAVYLGPLSPNLTMARWRGFTALYNDTCGQSSQ